MDHSCLATGPSKGLYFSKYLKRTCFPYCYAVTRVTLPNLSAPVFWLEVWLHRADIDEQKQKRLPLDAVSLLFGCEGDADEMEI